MRLIGALGEKGRDYVTGCMSGSHPSLNSYTRPQTHCEVALGGDSLRKHVGLDEVIGIDTYNEVRIHIREEAKGKCSAKSLVLKMNKFQWSAIPKCTIVNSTEFIHFFNIIFLLCQ